jgi:hypothetical protein
LDWGLRSATSPIKPSSSHDIDYPVSSITTATAIRTRPNTTMYVGRNQSALDAADESHYPFLGRDAALQ